MSMMLALEGCDKTLKSLFAERLTHLLHVPTYKNKGEWSSKLDSSTYWRDLLEFGGTFLIDFMEQVRPSVILDRFYPSEWVYSQVFNRETNFEVLRWMDERFNAMGGIIILFRRRSYQGFVDDLHVEIDATMLERLDAKYEEFKSWTKCRVVEVWLETEDLQKETDYIIQQVLM